MSGNINIIGNSDGTDYSTAEYVEARTNVTGQLTPVAEISPERGLYTKIRNHVSMGSKIGVPIYGDFRDSNGDPLPTNTEMAIAIKPLGEDQRLLVSDTVDNISYWNQNSITTQRDEENIDSVKVPLKYPPGVNNEGRPDAININGVDTGYLLMDSAAELDWTESEFHVEGEAVTQGRN
jgi:hypothetical protein